MAVYRVQDTSLTAVADAIRAKAGTSDALTFPDGFVKAVGGIQAGGGSGGGGMWMQTGTITHATDVLQNNPMCVIPVDDANGPPQMLFVFRESSENITSSKAHELFCYVSSPKLLPAVHYFGWHYSKIKAPYTIDNSLALHKDVNGNGYYGALYTHVPDFSMLAGSTYRWIAFGGMDV